MVTAELPTATATEVWWAHLVTTDQHGNQQVQTFGSLIRTAAPLPSPTLTKSRALVTDADGDGQIIVGDTVGWTLVLTNTTSEELVDWEVEDPLGSELTLVAGSLQSSAGTAQSTADGIVVTGSTLTAGAQVTISYQTLGVAAGDGFGDNAIAQAANAATTRSDESETTLLDDPPQLPTGE